MLPSSHIASGVLLFAMFYAIGIDTVLALSILVGAMLPDLDYPFYRGNHRSRITHTPIFWVAVLAPLSFVHSIFAFLLLGILVHIILDTLDWGVMWLHPLSNNFYGGLLRAKKIESRFLHHYLSHNGFVALEILFGIVAVASSYFILL